MTRGYQTARAALIALTVLVVLWVATLSSLLFYPPARTVLTDGVRSSTWVTDAHGGLLREVVNAEGVRWRPVSLDQISFQVRRALLVAEDQTFYEHGGVDFGAIARAFASNVRRGTTVSGASTLSMQLARILYREPRNFAGKLAQAFDAWRLETWFSKDRILEAYLNRAPFGPALIGIEAASQWYFSKAAQDLSWAEAALLVGMLQAPTDLDPVANPAMAKKRRDWVLARLETSGDLRPADRVAAEARPLPTVESLPRPKAGHFVDWTLSSKPAAGEVRTSLDPQLQESVEGLVEDYVNRSRILGITNAAVVVLDNSTSQVLAMVGSKGWSSLESGFVNGAVSLRQPGSTLKPFLYTLAFSQGWSPTSVLADVPTKYVNNDRTLYIPRNYSRTFRGPVLAAEALATSLNIPAIRLLRSVGVTSFLKTLHALGFDDLNQSADHYGLGLILGNGEVTLLQLAGAYATLARGGVYLPPTPRTQTSPGVRVFPEVPAYLTTSILSDEAMRIEAFGANNPLLVGFPMAIKTGTSSDWKDSWTVGYTSDFTVAVWTGDFGGTPMNQISGSVGAGPLFQSIARVVASSRLGSPELPQPPNGVRKVLVCAESGDLPNEFCPRKLLVTVAEDVRRSLCDVHSLVAVDGRTGEPATDQTPEVFVTRRLAYHLSEEYGEWLDESGKFVPPASERAPRGRENQARLAIASPRSGDIYVIEPGYDPSTQTVELSAQSRFKIANVDWWIDGTFWQRSSWPYRGTWPLEKGKHTVQLRSDNLLSELVGFEVR